MLSPRDDAEIRCCRRGRVDGDDGDERRPDAELRLLLLLLDVMCCWGGREEVRPDLEDDDDEEEEEEEVLPPVRRATVAARLWRMVLAVTSDRAGDGADSGGRRGRDTSFSLRVDVHDDD